MPPTAAAPLSSSSQAAVDRDAGFGLPFFQIDAFTARPLAGNPAAVIVLPLTEAGPRPDGRAWPEAAFDGAGAPVPDAWPPDGWLRAVAAENNLAETAFVAGERGAYALRWFTPTVEVDLCGHATLAAAHALRHLDPAPEGFRFLTRSGPLHVRREPDGRWELDLPLRELSPLASEAGSEGGAGATALRAAVARAVGLSPGQVHALLRGRDLVAVVEPALDLRALQPDMAAIAALEGFALCVTASPGARDGDVDFVSRFFAPAEGIPEDPVTGSAHCALGPLWASRLGRSRLRARQVSPRSGELDVEVRGDRVALVGAAVDVIRGTWWVVPPDR
jgi:PhzF family phenazine biosynthesis protein